MRLVLHGVLAFSLVATTGSVAAAWTPPSDVPEIAVTGLGDVAMATMMNGQAVILYDPTVTATLPPDVVAFFEAHEYGHVVLGHLAYSSTTDPQVRQALESEADCYAAQAVGAEAAAEAAELFATWQGDSRPDWYHPTGNQRAAGIAACAGSTGSGGECHVETETVTEYEWTYVTEEVPCSHCGYVESYWGYVYTCAHGYDVVSVPVQVPVERQVERTVCE